MTKETTIAEMEARVAAWMGVDKPPTRDLAMVRVGLSYIRATGHTFDLKNGEHLPMPPWEELPKPDGSDNANDRYAFRVAMHLGDKIAAEVDAYRLPAPAYGSDLNLWPAIHQTLWERGVFSAYVLALIDETSVSDKLATASIEYIVGEAIAATAEDRLRALCAVLDEMEKK